jgi:DNA-binding HxlR family transcriptional regulator
MGCRSMLAPSSSLRIANLSHSGFVFQSTSRYASFPGVPAMPRRRRQVTPDASERGDAALARAFEFLGKRWNAVVLGNLRSGPAGFRELSRAIGGISDSVLSDRLSDLVAAGLIARTVDEGPPLAVSYSLTDRGAALMPALEQVSLWAQEHLVED